MNRELLDFLGGSRSIPLDDITAELRIVSAYELIRARVEAQGLSDESGLALAACVLSRAVFRDDKRLFSSGEELMKAASAERLTELMERYKELAERVDVSFSSEPETVETLKKSLGHAYGERLRWRVLKNFGVLPSQAGDMTNADFLYCVLNELLDYEQELERLCPSCRERARVRVCAGCGAALEDGLLYGDINPHFDLSRFEEMIR